MIGLITILCMFFFVSCGPPMPYLSEHPHVNRAYAINRETDAKLQRRGIYQPIISYRHQDKIGYFKRYYDTQTVQLKSIDDAKMFLCSLIDEFLGPLNSDLELRPFLKEYPLTWKNFDVLFSCYDACGNPLHAPYIHFTRKSGDSFICYDYDEKAKKFIIMHEEPMAIVYEWYTAQKTKGLLQNAVSECATIS